MIALSCAACRENLSVGDELAGTNVTCPGCRQALVVPQLAALVSQMPNHVLKDSAGVADLEAGLGGTPGVDTVTWAGTAPREESYDFLAPPQQPDELGRLGPFQVLQVLGAGGMGVVFKAEDPRLKRPVALKAMLPSVAARESSRKRFVRGAMAAAALDDDHIVPIFQVGEDRGIPFLAMQLLEGESLAERLRRQPALTVLETVRIGRDTAWGLAAAHRHGLIHRDIKPAHLWLESRPAHDFRVKILDFGLGRVAVADAQLPQSGAIVGTPAYMAPEQAAGEPADHRSDLFSLGCVLYRLTTGSLPFKGKDAITTLVAVAAHCPAPPAQIAARLPRELSDLILRLLAKKPEERPESARAVAEAMEEIEAAVRARSRRRRSRRRVCIALATLVLGVGIASLIAVWPRTAAPSPLIGDIVPTDGPESPPAAERDLKQSERMLAQEARRRLVEVETTLLPETLKPVVRDLYKRNPEFNGKLTTYRLENNIVTELQFPTNNVADLSPLRVLTGLKKLDCSGSTERRGKLADLSPLKGLPLTELQCSETAVADLSPLKGMPLRFLSCYRSPVHDLTPLQGMKLTTLWCWGTEVSDLTPLKGMPLSFLSCSFTKVSDLTPLTGMKLAKLFCQKSKVTDLSPLRGMPLMDLSCDFVRARDAEFLRSFKSLEIINERQAEATLGK